MKMQKVFQLFLCYNKLLTLTVQSVSTTCWEEHLAGVTTNPTVLGLQLWTTRAVRCGEEGCEMIDDFPPHGGQPNTKSSPGISSQECREKKIIDQQNSATSEHAS